MFLTTESLLYFLFILSMIRFFLVLSVVSGQTDASKLRKHIVPPHSCLVWTLARCGHPHLDITSPLPRRTPESSRNVFILYLAYCSTDATVVFHGIAVSLHVFFVRPGQIGFLHRVAIIWIHMCVESFFSFFVCLCFVFTPQWFFPPAHLAFRATLSFCCHFLPQPGIGWGEPHV